MPRLPCALQRRCVETKTFRLAEHPSLAVTVMTFKVLRNAHKKNNVSTCYLHCTKVTPTLPSYPCLMGKVRSELNKLLRKPILIKKNPQTGKSLEI